jgi:hypothetical protein
MIAVKLLNHTTGVVLSIFHRLANSQEFVPKLLCCTALSNNRTKKEISIENIGSRILITKGGHMCL